MSRSILNTTQSKLVQQLLSPPRPALRLRNLTAHITNNSPIASRPDTVPSLLSQSRKMSSIPSTMKAIVVNEVGGPEKLQYSDSTPVPALQDGEVLVKNEYAGVNYIDTYFRSGLYPISKFPIILGQEAAGTVAATKGSTLGLKEGDKVVYMKQGSYAEYTSVPADKVLKIPSGLSPDIAVGGYLMGMTALSLLREAYPVKKGETVLLHAAAGGMGLLMCQLLRDMGVTTIGTAGGPEKCKLAKENGATHTIDYRATSGPSWVEQVMKLTSGKGVDAVYDSVGKDTWEGSLEVVKRKGKVVYFGNSSGAIPPIQIQRLAVKNISIMRATMTQYTVTREELEDYGNDTLKLLNEGKLNVKIHKVYELKDTQQVHKDIESRSTTGKLLIKL